MVPGISVEMQVASMKVYVLESGKLAEYSGLLDQLVESDGQAPSLSLAEGQHELFNIFHDVVSFASLLVSSSRDWLLACRCSGCVQKVERHSGQVQPACLQSPEPS